MYMVSVQFSENYVAPAGKWYYLNCSMKLGQLKMQPVKNYEIRISVKVKLHLQSGTLKCALLSNTLLDVYS